MAAGPLMWKITGLVLRLGLGGLFVFAGAIKAWDTQQFALDVQNYQITSEDATLLVAVYLPWVEIFAGLALIVRRLQFGALAILTGLMLVFMAALANAWHREIDITCGCFGYSENATDFSTLLVRDLAILAALGVLTWIEVRTARANSHPPRKLEDILPQSV